MCLKHGILGTRIENIRVGMLGDWSMCVCVLDCPDRMAGWLFTQAHLNDVEWFLICTKASPVLLRAGEECFTYLS